VARTETAVSCTVVNASYATHLHSL